MLIYYVHVCFIPWLQHHLIPCPFKYLTGIDCPGCGLQRSVIALIQGDFHRSITLYPATIPLLFFFLYSFADRYFKLDTPKRRVRTTLSVIICALILVTYTIKLSGL